MIWAFSYSANMPWNCTSNWSSGRVAARALDELHPGARAAELLDQQGLVGELAGQPVRRVAQHHVDPDPDDQVAQPLQGRADQRGAGVALVLEHPIVGDSSPSCSACARSAAVCDAIVSSFFCRADDTRA